MSPWETQVQSLRAMVEFCCDAWVWEQRCQWLCAYLFFVVSCSYSGHSTSVCLWRPQVQWRHRKQMLLLELVLPVNPKRRDMWTRLDLTSVAIVTQERPCTPSWPRETPLSLGPFAVLLLGTAASESALPLVLVCAGHSLWTFGHLGECVVVSCCVFYFYL